jgi:hypothetical protein
MRSSGPPVSKEGRLEPTRNRRSPHDARPRNHHACLALLSSTIRYLALHPPMQFHGHAEKVEDRAKDQIEYPDEDPFIRNKFADELAKRGVTSLMPDEAYANRNYEWSKAMGKQYGALSPADSGVRATRGRLRTVEVARQPERQLRPIPRQKEGDQLDDQERVHAVVDLVERHVGRGDAL